MFGIGMPELTLVLLVALIVMGPERLPEVARAIGRAMTQFKDALNDRDVNRRDTGDASSVHGGDKKDG